MTAVLSPAIPLGLWRAPLELSGAERIAAFNDRFRMSLGSLFASGVPGQVMLSHAVTALPAYLQLIVLQKVRAYDDFRPGTNPYLEHDFGSLAIDSVGEKIYWKIDVYADNSFAYGAEDPADVSASFRVLSIMLASDY